MVAIATYVVVEPQSAKVLLRELLACIAEQRPTRLVLEAVDDNVPHKDVIEFHVRDTSHDGMGSHGFVGFFFDIDDNLQPYVVNLVIPPWEGMPSSVKLAPYKTEQEV